MCGDGRRIRMAAGREGPAPALLFPGLRGWSWLFRCGRAGRGSGTQLRPSVSRANKAYQPLRSCPTRLIPTARLIAMVGQETPPSGPGVIWLGYADAANCVLSRRIARGKVRPASGLSQPAVFAVIAYRKVKSTPRCTCQPEPELNQRSSWQAARFKRFAAWQEPRPPRQGPRPPNNRSRCGAQIAITFASGPVNN